MPDAHKKKKIATVIISEYFIKQLIVSDSAKHFTLTFSELSQMHPC